MLLCGLAGSTTGHSSLKPPPPEPRREPGASPTGRRFKARTSLRFMLLAEDLLLLLTDDDTGKLAASSTEVDVALGGALLAELALMDRVDVAGADERVREGRLVVRDANPTADGLLDEALAVVEHKEGKKPKSVVARSGRVCGCGSTTGLCRVVSFVPRAIESSASSRRIGGPLRMLPTRCRCGPDLLQVFAMARLRTRERARSLRCCTR
jgi:hypothetical protein